ncbi:hypothetical protein [Lactobacillus sp. CBA3605]|uniref:hypothetical protein n=1 Tax=Lactobacillus sp. CBA3605 TaxID=2099788 RepID=UPI001319DAEE|nr:hypothetical protein [Lactobacillus sp. CBA3605]
MPKQIYNYWSQQPNPNQKIIIPTVADYQFANKLRLKEAIAFAFFALAILLIRT